MEREIKVPFTKNTSDSRTILARKGFTPLSFFQGKEYIYPLITNWANKDGSWQEKEYSTCSEERLSENKFMKGNCLSVEDFEKELDRYIQEKQNNRQHP